MGVITNAPTIDESVSRMTRGASPQEALETGAYDQLTQAMSWTIDEVAASERTTPTYWEALIGDPLDTQAVRKTHGLEIQYLSKLQVYEKLPITHARQAGHQVLGVRWVDVRKADGTRCSRLVAKEIKTHNAPELFVATPPI